MPATPRRCPTISPQRRATEQHPQRTGAATAATTAASHFPGFLRLAHALICPPRRPTQPADQQQSQLTHGLKVSARGCAAVSPVTAVPPRVSPLPGESRGHRLIVLPATVHLAPAQADAAGAPRPGRRAARGPVRGRSRWGATSHGNGCAACRPWRGWWLVGVVGPVAVGA